MNQTEWLNNATTIITTQLIGDALKLDTRHIIEARINVGYPAQGSRHKDAALGVAVYRPEDSASGVAQVFIDPRITDTQEAAYALFVGLAKVALLSEPTPHKVTKPLQYSDPDDWTTPPAPMGEILLNMLAQLGRYPAPGLNLPKHVPQKGRMIKFQCAHCDWQAYTSRKQLEAMAVGCCPACGEHDALRIPE